MLGDDASGESREEGEARQGHLGKEVQQATFYDYAERYY